MNARNPIPVMFLILVLVLMGGCKKKPKTIPVAATQPPTVTAPVTTPPSATDVPMDPAVKNNPPSIPQTKPRPITRSKTVARKPQPKPPIPEPGKPVVEEPVVVAKVAPSRITIQPGATAESNGAVSPEMSHSEEAHHRQTTEQLMQSTEANLKSLRLRLTVEERSLLQQVQLFMAQSREATLNQDLVRAHNLALKAHLLSDELVR